jgi:hypothetical protein
MLLKDNFTLVVSGASRSGKTRLILHMLENADKCLTKFPSKIIICFGCDQMFYKEFNKFGVPVILQKGVPKNPPSDALIIFDDLQHEANLILDYYTKFSHHNNLSVIYITQNIFLKQNRGITLNASYIILFSSWRDKKQVSILGSQISPKNCAWILESYTNATNTPYSYIMFDFTQEAPNELRLRDNLDPYLTHYYVDKDAYEYLDIKKEYPNDMVRLGLM